MRFICALALLAGAFRLRTHRVRKAAEPVQVLHFDATVEYVDYVSLAHHEDLKNFTEASLADFLVDVACGAGAAEGEALVELKAVKANRKAMNETAPAAGEKCSSAVVRLFGNPFHIHAELPYSPEAEAALKDPAVPKMLSDFLTKVPSVLLYASAPPINEYAAVSSANITSVIPGCESHLEHLIKEFRAAYTNRMVPWALDGACGAFATTLSFATTNKPSDADKAFCETATKHLMRHHYGGVDFKSGAHVNGPGALPAWEKKDFSPEEKDYQEWCVNVCEYRHGPTAICAVAGAGENATNATGGGNGTNATNGTNASLFVKARKRQRRQAVLKRMQNP
jgi:hypothetical protein